LNAGAVFDDDAFILMQRISPRTTTPPKLLSTSAEQLPMVSSRKRIATPPEPRQGEGFLPKRHVRLRLSPPSVEGTPCAMSEAVPAESGASPIAEPVATARSPNSRSSRAPSPPGECAFATEKTTRSQSRVLADLIAQSRSSALCESAHRTVADGAAGAACGAHGTAAATGAAVRGAAPAQPTLDEQLRALSHAALARLPLPLRRLVLARNAADGATSPLLSSATASLLLRTPSSARLGSPSPSGGQRLSPAPPASLGPRSPPNAEDVLAMAAIELELEAAAEDEEEERLWRLDLRMRARGAENERAENERAKARRENAIATSDFFGQCALAPRSPSSPAAAEAASAGCSASAAVAGVGAGSGCGNGGMGGGGGDGGGGNSAPRGSAMRLRESFVRDATRIRWQTAAGNGKHAPPLPAAAVRCANNSCTLCCVPTAAALPAKQRRAVDSSDSGSAFGLGTPGVRLLRQAGSTTHGRNHGASDAREQEADEHCNDLCDAITRQFQLRYRQGRLCGVEGTGYTGASAAMAIAPIRTSGSGSGTGTCSKLGSHSVSDPARSAFTSNHGRMQASTTAASDASPENGKGKSSKGKGRTADLVGDAASLIGLGVRKHFVNHGWFQGEVVSWRSAHSVPWFMVRYEDGDEEELLEEHIRAIATRTTLNDGHNSSHGGGRARAATETIASSGGLRCFCCAGLRVGGGPSSLLVCERCFIADRVSSVRWAGGNTRVEFLVQWTAVGSVGDYALLARGGKNSTPSVPARGQTWVLADCVPPELLTRSLGTSPAPAVVEQALAAAAAAVGSSTSGDYQTAGSKLSSTTAKNPHPKKRGASSAYFGVSLINGKWQARYRTNGGYISVGSFASEVEAARAFDRVTRNVPYYKEHGIVNFPIDKQVEGNADAASSAVHSDAPPIHIGRAPQPLRAGDRASEASWAVKRSWLGHRIYFTVGSVRPTRNADGSVALGMGVVLCEIHRFFCPPEVKAGYKHKNLFKVSR